MSVKEVIVLCGVMSLFSVVRCQCVLWMTEITVLCGELSVSECSMWMAVRLVVVNHCSLWCDVSERGHCSLWCDVSERGHCSLWCDVTVLCGAMSVCVVDD
eukprot:TRINITY_DN68928_c0_g2_i1.p1 TRINITY_DN68928_c0_g2~~TRINITY_DN68928_c0_g2_i1.p1  ORF type:complete len:101 (+),score=24.81 TRINITY_DN68928_c0_g2_i1:54-356(+)